MYVGACMNAASTHLHTCLQAHPQARSCLLLCTVCEDAHAGQPATMLGDDVYATYAAALREVARPAPGVQL